MASEAGSEKKLPLQEFGSMWFVTESIPLVAQRNLVHTKITLTALSCLEHWIAMASNIGIVYLYHRPSHALNRLKVPNYDGLLKTIDLICLQTGINTNNEEIGEPTLFIAIGTELGRIAIFVMEPPYALPEVVLLEVHIAPISSLLWAANKDGRSLKLYSGDQDGWVYNSTISAKHQVELESSQSVIQEDHEIVQLSLSSDKSLLLISTTSRAVVWDAMELTVRQVGRQNRKSLEVLGATFFPSPNFMSSSSEDVIYAARPNFRLWRASILGQVLETIKFQDIVMSPDCDKVALSSTPGVVHTEGEISFLSFGRFLPYRRTFLLAWTSIGFLLIDPRSHSIAIRTPPLAGLTDVSICGEEIFLLIFPRILVRLAYSPDRFHPPFQHLKEATPVDMLQMVIHPFERLGSLISKPSNHHGSFHDDNVDAAKPRAKSDNLFGWIRRRRSSPSPQISRASSSASLASNNPENPTIKPMDPENSPPHSSITSQSTKSQNAGIPDPLQDLPPIFGLLDETPPPGEVVLVHAKKKKKKKNKESISSQEGLPKSEMETSSDSVDVFIPSPPPPKVGPTFSEDDLDAAMDRIIQAYKDQKIAGSITVQEERNELGDESHSSTQEDSSHPVNSTGDASSQFDAPKNLNRPPLAKKGTLDIYSTDSVDIADEDLYEKPSQENKLNSLLLKKEDVGYSSVGSLSISAKEESSGDVLDSTSSIERAYNYRGNWVQCPSPPGSILSLCVWKDFVIGTNRDSSIFYAPLGGLGLKWSVVPKKLSQQVTASADHLLFLHNNNVIIPKKSLSSPSDLDKTSLYLLERDIQHINVDSNLVWCVKNDGSLCYHTLPPEEGLSQAATNVGVPLPVTQVNARNGKVWVLTDSSSYPGLSQILAGGKDANGIWTWKQLKSPRGVTLWTTMALGDKETGWALDDILTLWFTMEPFKDDPSWWQVELSEPLYTEVVTSSGPFLSPLHPRSSPGISHSCIVASGDHGVWIGQGSTLLHASRSVVGHRWSEITLAGNTSLKWRLIAAEGQEGESGLVWGVLINGAIFCWSDPQRPHQVSSPLRMRDFILDICAAPGVCWLLTAQGRVYARMGLKEGTNSEGADWAELNLDQLGSERLETICCSNEVAWGVSTEGTAYVSMGPSVPLPKPSPARAWIAVENWEPSSRIVQVCLGSHLQLWAMDAEGEIWTHYGMSAHVPIGTSWARVTGLPGPANRLSVSRDTVWVLATLPYTDTRELFVRCGAPPFGDFWQKVPSPSNDQLDTLSVSQDNQVWGIRSGDGLLVKLQTTTIELVKCDKDPILMIPSSPGSNVEDWEMVPTW